MKTLTKILLTLLIAHCTLTIALAQNIAITDDDAYTAKPSAMLDVMSTTKGMLVPRLTTAQRTAVASPATGLLVFDTDAGSFYFYNGTSWVNLTSGNASGILGYTAPDKVYLTDANDKLGVGTIAPNNKLDIRADATNELDQAIFNVVNNDGDTVFAVYPHGVRINVVDEPNGTRASSTKGGFAVGGFSPGRGATTSEYLRVTPDSIRMNIEEGDLNRAESSKGGFAVGGFSPGRSNPKNYFNIYGSNTVDTISPSEARIFWYPLKEAFLAGRVLVESSDSVGTNSFATGNESKAIGNFSQAFGYNAKARGENSTAIGYKARADGANSFAFGDKAKAMAIGSFAFGSVGRDTLTGNPTANYTVANGDYSMAIGLGATTNNFGAYAFGLNTTASGDFAMAIGENSACYGKRSYAFGTSSIALSDGAFAIGGGCRADSAGGFAIGIGANARGSMYGSFAFGNSVLASGAGSTAFGYKTTASGAFSLATGEESAATAYNSSAFGYHTTAGGRWSATFGMRSSTTGDAGFASGNYAQANGQYSSAFGNHAVASGASSFATGYYTTSSNTASTAMGYSTTASGLYSTAFGREITAEGNYSFAIALDDQNGAIVSQANSMAIMGGKVGIGTVAPTSALEVYSDASYYYAAEFHNDGNNIDRYGIKIQAGEDTPAGIGYFIRFYDGNGTYEGSIRNNMGTVDLYNVSDIRLKKNVLNTKKQGLSIVNNIRVVDFSFLEDEKNNIQTGFIAQELKEVYPEMVVLDDETGFYNISNSRLIPVLTKAIQEQQTMIDKLIEQNNILMQRIENLENR
ncbi:MAG TPA: hypothetical protein DDX39_00185 [Bacteroidales bacterium]|nr:MAG: hypothetical protein A2W98_03370 [Bacteroidetes bacterium GWF2_33_38]HBF87027.1 hypothetical protein [Bacteroidales bacterium]